MVYWDDKEVKKICVGCESLNQALLLPELVPLSRIVRSLSAGQLPVAILGASPSLIRVLEDNRCDGRRFVVYLCFDEETLLRCVLQADQVVFGMVSVTTLVEYLVHRLKSALYEDWTEDILILRKCIRQGSVGFIDYRQFLSEVVDLWPTIRPSVRCTSHPDAKGKADSGSCFFFSLFFLLVICHRFFPLLVCVLYIQFVVRLQMNATDWYITADKTP